MSIILLFFSVLFGFFLVTYLWFEFMNIRFDGGSVGLGMYSDVNSFKSFLKALKTHSYIIIASPILLIYLLVRKGME